MRISDISLDVYREECARASEELAELRDFEVIEVTLPEGLEARIERLDFSDPDTLVGAMRSPRQLGICLKRKFYHIPAVYIEEYPIPKYIALYQSQRMFGDEVSGIKYYGEVKKCTPMRRSKIREIPKSSNEIYYKFKIKKWKRLDKAVESGELGFVRLFTSILLLESVDDVSALTIDNPYDFRLYKLLKLTSSEIDAGALIACFSVDGLYVVFTKEIIYLCDNGKICERYWRSGLAQTPSLVLRKMKKDIVGILEKGKEKKDEI